MIDDSCFTMFSILWIDDSDDVYIASFAVRSFFRLYWKSIDSGLAVSLSQVGSGILGNATHASAATRFLLSACKAVISAECLKS